MKDVEYYMEEYHNADLKSLCALVLNDKRCQAERLAIIALIEKMGYSDKAASTLSLLTNDVDRLVANEAEFVLDNLEDRIVEEDFGVCNADFFDYTKHNPRR